LIAIPEECESLNLEIRWPLGRRTTLNLPAAPAEYVVRESDVTPVAVKAPDARGN
jgi:hypothetical protein